MIQTLPLNKRKCIPCEVGSPPLSNDIALKLLKEIGGNWAIEDGKLNKKSKFNNFRQAISYINKVAKIANEENHHPDINLYGYNKVGLTLYTHASKGLTENDFILADKINQVTL